MVAVPTGRLSETVGASDRMSRVPSAASRKLMISWATVMWNAACALGGGFELARRRGCPRRRWRQM